MIHITFNPWLSPYKEPFGAVPTNQRTTIRLTATGVDLLEVACVYHLDGTDLQEILMEVTADNWFVGQLPELSKGLYFYHFKIRYIEEETVKIAYFGKSSNEIGEGKLVYDYQEVKEFQLTCYQVEDMVSWYTEGVAYQIFPDRFYNHLPGHQVLAERQNQLIYGKYSDRPIYVKNEVGDVVRWDFFGGTLQGIQEKIPYLLQLGITIVYLNPIFMADSNHRYDTNDYFEIDSLLGTKADFLSLVEALHQSGIRLILDGVFSHVGKNSRYFNQDGRYGELEGASRNQESDYYPWFTFEHYPDKYEAWWGIKDLPEVKKENQVFQAMIYENPRSVIHYWSQLGVDGWRLDVADELPDAFIQGIRTALRQYPDKLLIGEVWEDASNKVSYNSRRQYVFGDNLQGVMNYPFREAILDLLLHRQEVAIICQQVTTLIDHYPMQFLLQSLTNIGTHDTARIYTELQENKPKLYLAIVLLVILPGVPCLYYGDEVKMTGQADPDNRAFFPWQTMDEELLQFCQTWIDYRKNYASLQLGDTYFFSQGLLFGCLRQLKNEWTVLLVNPSEQSQRVAIHNIQWLRSVTAPMIDMESIMKQFPEVIAATDFWVGTFDGETKIDEK